MPAKPKTRRSQLLDDSSFVRYYLKKYKKEVIIGLLSLLIVDALDVIPPLLLKSVVDLAIERGPLADLGFFALGYLGISLVQGVGRYAWRMYLVRASVLSGRDLRAFYTKKLFQFPISFFEHHRMGDLMSMGVSDVDAVRMAMGAGILVFADALFFIFTVPIAMWMMSPSLTLLVCLPLPLIPYLVVRNEKVIHERFSLVQECFGKLSAMVQENIHAVRLVKSFAQEDLHAHRVRELGEKFVDLNLKLSRAQTLTGPLFDFIMSLSMVTLLFWAGRSMILDPASSMTLGMFVAFQRYLQKMIWPMSALGMAINYFQKALSSSRRIQETLSDPIAIPSDESALASRLVHGRTPGRIEMRNLSFCYPGSQQAVLRSISLVIEPGQRVALIGAIGAGKTSLMSLIPKLYPVESGMLWVDGQDINRWSTDELRAQIGFVSQDVVLFNESILDNVAFGLHDWVGQEQVEQASHLASVSEEIQSLEFSFRTRLGDRGVNLSGGQRQRLTLARALIKEPSILILDDALSSVDLQTEEKILSSLKNRPLRNTELIAAHRISSVQEFDQILVMSRGEILQMGTHAELISQSSGLYYQYCEQQKLKDDLESYEHELSQTL